MSIIWQPVAPLAALADLLGCPVFGDRTPAVEAAWQQHLAEMRYWLAGQCAVSNTAVQGDPSTQIQQWELCHTDPEGVRESCRDLPVYSLASRRDGLGDIFLGQPGVAPGIRASDLDRSVALLSALAGEDALDAYAYRDDPDRLELLKLDYSPQRMAALSANLYDRYCHVVGTIALDRLIHGDLDGEERQGAFSQALEWEHEVEWPLARQWPHRPVTMLRAFDAAIVAAGFIRWLRFWKGQAVGIRSVGSDDLGL